MRKTLRARRLIGTLIVAAIAGSLSLATPAVATPREDRDPTQPTRVPSPNKAPNTVWRVDTRPPAEIFPSGFGAWGEDDNIVAHVDTSSNPESAYVSTTTNPHFLGDFATLIGSPGQTVWVYEIRATENFYNTTGSLAWIRDNTSIHLALREVAGNLTSTADQQGAQEWSALTGIPSSQIRRAAPLAISALHDPGNDGRNPLELVGPWVNNTENWIPNDDSRANPYLITNPAFTGVDAPKHTYNCAGKRIKCGMGGFTTPRIVDPFDGKQVVIRSKMRHDLALNISPTGVAGVHPAHEGDSQTFTAERDPERGLYRLRSSPSWSYLYAYKNGNVRSDKTKDGASLWSFERQSDGWFRITAHDPKNSPKGAYLTIYNPDGLVLTSTSELADLSRWSINPLGSPFAEGRTFPISAATMPSLRLQAEGASPAGGANVSVTNHSVGANTRWNAIYDKQGRL